MMYMKGKTDEHLSHVVVYEVWGTSCQPFQPPWQTLHLYILDFKTPSSLKYGENIHLGAEILDASVDHSYIFYQSIQY